MKKVAIVEKNKSNVNWKQYFPDFDFDMYALSTVKKKKLLVADIDIEINEDDYDFIIPIGAEPTKYFDKTASVVSHQGYLTKNKYIPLINPVMIRLKPEGKPMFDHSIENINAYIQGTLVNTDNFDVELIRDTGILNQHLDFLISKNLSLLSVDTETTALYSRKGYVLGISLSYKKEQGVYIDTNYIDEAAEEKLQLLFNTTKVIFHGSKFDIHFLQDHFDFKFPKFHDTMLLHYILDENSSHSLKDLAIRYTKLGDYDRELEIWKSDYCKKNKILKRDFTYDLIPFEILGKYAALDTAATFELFELFYSKVKRSNMLYNVYSSIMIPGCKALGVLEDNGIPFDREELEATKVEINNTLIDLEKQLYEFDIVKQFEAERGEKFNPNSYPQKRELLFEWLKLPIPDKKTDGGEISTDEEVMTELSELHELPAIILKISKEKKIKGTYVDKVLLNLDTDNRLRTNFNQHITTSGRLSSSGTLNAQNMPRDDKRVKKSIKAKKGYKIVSADLKTAEMYIAAVISGDKAMQKIFSDGTDFHGMIAIIENKLKCSPNEVAKLFPKERQEAKTFGFKVLYQLFLEHPVLSRFPTLKGYLLNKSDEVMQNGYLYSVFGRKRRVPNVKSDNRSSAAHYVRSAINFLFQSTASDINLLATIDAVQEIKDNNIDAKIFMLVHDSIVAEVLEEDLDKYCGIIVKDMQKDRGCTIPGSPIGVDFEIGENYAF